MASLMLGFVPDGKTEVSKNVTIALPDPLPLAFTDKFMPRLQKMTAAMQEEDFAALTELQTADLTIHEESQRILADLAIALNCLRQAVAEDLA